VSKGWEYLGILPLTLRRATFTIHDQPSILLDYSRKKELMDAALHHKSELALPSSIAC
jgi:hypothetical protein